MWIRCSKPPSWHQGACAIGGSRPSDTLLEKMAWSRSDLDQAIFRFAALMRCLDLTLGQDTSRADLAALLDCGLRAADQAGPCRTQRVRSCCQ